MGDIAQGDEGEDEDGGSAHHHCGSYRVHPDVLLRPRNHTAHGCFQKRGVEYI